MHFVWLRSSSLRVLKFLVVKEVGPNFWGEPISQNVWIILSLLLYFKLQSSLDPNSSSFNRFQSIVHEWGRLFSESWNFHKLRRGANFWGEPIFQKIWIIWPPFLYFNLKSSVHPNSLSFIRFQSILHEWGRLCSDSWNFYKLRRGGEFLGGTNFAECLNYLVPASVFQF